MDISDDEILNSITIFMRGKRTHWHD